MADPSPLTVEQALADPQLFRAWLDRHEPHEFHVRSLCHCPLAEYLSESCRIFANVAPSGAGWMDHAAGLFRKVALPMWAYDFMVQIDCLSMDSMAAAFVSAPEALRILDEVLAAAEVPA
jgi:hypothetical protein